VLSFTIGRTGVGGGRGPTVGSGDDWQPAEVFCGVENSASWPTRLLLESFSAVSVGRSTELGDPNAGEWYRLRRTLLAPCRLNVPLVLLENTLVGISGAAVEVGERVDEGAVVKSEPIAGEPARDGLSEERNGCWALSGGSRMSNVAVAKRET
jgi:hypothetical protein